MNENQEQRQQVSRRDVESVSAKLKALAQDLPESERAVLGLVLSRAQAARDIDPAEAGRAAAAGPAAEEVRDSAFEQPFAGQLARAAGLFDKPEVTVVVGWQYRFGLTDAPGEVVSPVIDAGETS